MLACCHVLIADAEHRHGSNITARLVQFALLPWEENEVTVFWHTTLRVARSLFNGKGN